MGSQCSVILSRHVHWRRKFYRGLSLSIRCRLSGLATSFAFAMAVGTRLGKDAKAVGALYTQILLACTATGVVVLGVTDPEWQSGVSVVVRHRITR